jgi:translation initiation factor RLI1
MLEQNMKALIKVQYVDSVAKSDKVNKQIVGPTLKKRDAKNLYEHAVD